MHFVDTDFLKANMKKLKKDRILNQTCIAILHLVEVKSTRNFSCTRPGRFRNITEQSTLF